MTATLAGVVATLGPTLARVAVAPSGVDIAVLSTYLHDPLDPEGEIREGDLVLAVGIDPTAPAAVELVQRCALAHAAAVVIKSDDAEPAPLVAAARDAGIAVVVTPAETSWAHLHALTHSAVSVASAIVEEPAGVSDLFVLADAIAARVGGAVTIEDRFSTVLAYSSGDYPIDDARRATILGRRVPDEWVKRQREHGVFDELRHSQDVVRVHFADDYAYRPRLAIAVRAGDEMLGSIWAVESDDGFTDEAQAVLRESARLAAIAMLRRRSAEDVVRQRRRETLRAVLDGGLAPESAAATLGLAASSPMAVLAIHLGDATDADALAAAERALEAIELAAHAFRRRLAGTVIGGTAYVVAESGTRVGDADGLRAYATDLARRVRTDLPVTAVAPAANGFADIPSARRDADLALAVVLSGGTEARVVHVDDVRAPVALLRLRDAVGEAPWLRSPAVDALLEHDRRRGGALVATLRAYLDANGDVPRASALLGIHPNTCRYRIERLVDIAGLDLDDPAGRLLTHLDLHLRGEPSG